MSSPVAIPAVLLTNYVLLFGAMCGLGFVSLRTVKSHGDVVRKGFTWYHTTFWLLIIGAFLSIVTYALLISLFYQDNFEASEALVRISSITEMFFFVTNAALLLCTSELAVGLKLAVKQQRSKAFRIYILVLSSLIALLMAGFYIYEQYRFTTRFSSAVRYAGIMWAVGIVGLIGIAALLLGTLSVAIFALKQRSAAKKNAGGLYAKAGSLIALAACLNLALVVWNVVVGLVVGLAGYANTGAWTLADAIISHWGTFAVLIIIHQLGKKKADGLWSTPAGKTDNAPELGGAHIIHNHASTHPTSHV